MKTKGIRILDKKNNIVSVELLDILSEIPKGHSFDWSILHLYATGCLSEHQSIPAFEEKIRQSEKGFLVSWEELNDLAKKFWDLIDITIIGCADKSLIQRYDNSKKMYETCDFVIEMIDSGYWEVFSKNIKWIDQLATKFQKVEFLAPDFQK